MSDFFRRRESLLARAGRGVTVVAISALVMAGCGRRTTEVERATAANTLLLNNGAEPAEFDPQLATGVPEVRMLEALFEGLTQSDPVDLHARPGVAERWEVSPDGRTYTFHLRADARWSDGTPLTADDFVAGIRRLLSPALASDLVETLFYLEGAEDYFRGRTDDFTTVGYRALDARTIEARLSHPKPFFPAAVSERAWYPIPRHVLTRFGGLAGRAPEWTRPENLVGNGPFVLREWRPRQFVTLEKSATYWDRANVRLGTVRLFAIDNQTADEAAFRSGRLHKTYLIPANKLETWRREQPTFLRTAPRSAVYFYAFNVKRPPFDDVRVRQALAQVIDREALVQQVTRGGETPAYHFTPAGIGGYVSQTRVRYDPGEARRLLAAAGFPEGRGFPVVTLLFNTADRHRVIAESMQHTWRAELGVDIKLQNEEWGVYLNSMDTRNFEIIRAGLFIEPYDPWLFLRTYKTGFGFNRTDWSDGAYDALVDALEAEPDPAARDEFAQQAEARLLEAMPIIPLYFSVDNYLLDPVVQDWTDNLIDIYPLRQAGFQP